MNLCRMNVTLARTALMLLAIAGLGFADNNASENCPLITLPGTYVMTMNYTGPHLNPTYGYFPGTSCVAITASDVVFDCDGYTMNGSGDYNLDGGNLTADISAGVIITSSVPGMTPTNVTVKNCNARGYFYGYYVRHADNVTLMDDYAYDTYAGPYDLDFANNASVINVSSYNSGSGITLYNSWNSTLVGNNDTLTSWGIQLSNNSYCNIVNNTMSNVSMLGMSLNKGAFNNVTGNTVYKSGLEAFSLNNINNSNFLNNAANNCGHGAGIIHPTVEIFGSNNNVSGNNLSDNYEGYYIVGVNNTITDNSAYNHNRYSITVEGNYARVSGNLVNISGSTGLGVSNSNYSNITNNTVTVSNGSAISVSYGSFDNVSNNIAYNTSIGLSFSSLTNSTIEGNGAWNNSFYGFNIRISNSSIVNNTAYANQDGFYTDYLTQNDLFADNTARNNSRYGFYMRSTSNCTFRNDSANNNTNHGFYAEFTSQNNSYILCEANYNNDGFYLIGPRTNMSGASATGNRWDGIIILGDNSTCINSFAYNNRYTGIEFDSYYANFMNNTAINNNGSGFDFGSSSYSNFSNLTSVGNAYDGVDASYMAHSNLIGINASGNGYEGFYFDYDTDFNNFTDIVVDDNLDTGIYFDSESCNGNTFRNLSASGNALDGIYFYDGTSGNSFIGARVDGNGRDGFFFDTSSSNNLIINASAIGNSRWAFNSVGGSDNNTAVNFSMGSVHGSFVARDVSLRNVSNPSVRDIVSGGQASVEVAVLSADSTYFKITGVSSGSGLGVNSFSSDTNYSGAWNYSFDQDGYPFGFDAAQSLTPLSSPTVIWSAANNTDEAVSAAIPIGFNVMMFGRNDTHVKVSSNGFIYLNEGAPVSTNARWEAAPDLVSLSLGNSDHLVSGAWNDLRISTGDVEYGTEGSAPNRVFIVYFNNVSRYGSTAGGFIFQIKLFENGTGAESTVSPLALPSGYHGIGRYFEAISNSMDSFLFMNMSYEDGDVAGFNESALFMAKRGAEWVTNTSLFANPHGALPDENVVFANITGFGSLFTVLEELPESGCPVISAAGAYSIASDLVGAPNPVDEIREYDKACVKINASDVLLDCAGHSITDNGTAGIAYGIVAVGPLTNVTVQNCPSVSNYSFGAYYWHAQDGAMRNITVTNSYVEGITLINSSGNNLSELVTRDNVYNGIGIDNSSCRNSIESVSAYRNGASGIVFYRDANLNNVSQSSAYENGDVGVSLGSASGGNIFTNVSSDRNNISGFYITDSDGNILRNCTASDNNQSGFFFGSSDGTQAYGCAAENNPQGFWVFSSEGVTLIGNNASGSSGPGFSLSHNSSNAVFSSNRAWDSDEGYWLSNTSGNEFSGDLAYDISGIGFDLSSAHDTILTNVTSRNNFNGIGIFGASTNCSIQNSAVHGNLGYGIYSGWANATEIADSHIYDNKFDVQIQLGSAQSVNILHVAFDSPPGLYENFTVLSLHDTAASSNGFTINWTRNTSALPAGSVSFRQKFVDISALSGSPSIDRITWEWNDSESGAYNESRFGIWRYGTGGWALLNNTPDTDGNTLALSGMAPGSVYGILESNETPGGGDDDDDEDPSPALRITFESACDGSIVYVRSGGEGVPGAHVDVEDAEGLSAIASGTTDSDGAFAFQGCGMDVLLAATRSGYSAAESSGSLVACVPCAECLSDNDCPGTEKCSSGQCAGVDCPCGRVSNHSCTPYACCSDSACPSGQACRDNGCVEIPTPPECVSDSDCADNQRCAISQGAGGGACVEITGCGLATGHALVPFECGTGPGCPACPAGSQCLNHTCIATDLKGPDPLFVGESAEVHATLQGVACSGCDLVIIDPDGGRHSGRTDAHGNYSLPLNISGDYRVTLEKEGAPTKTIIVKALPKSPAVDEGPPFQAMSPLPCLALALLVVLALALYAIRKRRLMERLPKPGAKMAKGKPQ
jgi:parallel beta-helix repeat protein